MSKNRIVAMYIRLSNEDADISTNNTKFESNYVRKASNDLIPRLFIIYVGVIIMKKTVHVLREELKSD